MTERRARTLTDDDLAAITQAVTGSVSAEQHAEHHTFLESWIAREKRRFERHEKIKTQVGGWAIVGALSAIGSAAYHGLVYIKEHLK